MNARDALSYIETAAGPAADQALAKFVEWNPHWRGAHWADCLDVLWDSDSHLELTDDETLLPGVPEPWRGLALITAHYAGETGDGLRVLAGRIARSARTTAEGG